MEKKEERARQDDTHLFFKGQTYRVLKKDEYEGILKIECATLERYSRIFPLGNPFEGEEICRYRSHYGEHHAIVFTNTEKWQERHPEFKWDMYREYPDAVQASTSRGDPYGPIYPRTYTFAELTEPMIKKALKKWPWEKKRDPRRVLAKDISLYDIFPSGSDEAGEYDD